MEGHKDGWNVNVLAQYAGVAGLRDRAYQQASRQLCQTAHEETAKATVNNQNRDN